MKVTQKKLGEDRVQLDAIATAQEVSDAFDTAQLIFAQQMNIPLSEEKSTAQAAEEAIGIKDLDAVVTPQVTEILTPFALDKKNIVPAFPPKVKRGASPKRGIEYHFTLEVTLKPEYELSSYDPVSFTIQPFTVDEREVEAQLARMADSYAEYVADDPHPVQQGDSILISMKSFENGEPLQALTIGSRTYLMDANLMPPGFDENIIGMNVGETKTFTFSGPAYDEEGKEVEKSIESTVTVREIQKKVIPAITDAWVKEHMPMFQDLEMLKNMLRKQIGDAQGADYENYKQQRAASELSKRFSGKIADEVYESTRDTLVKNMQMQLQQQGVSYEQFVAQNGGEQQFGMMLMMQARQSLTEGYALDALFRHEKMTIDDDDILEACQTINPQQPHVVREQMEKAGYGFALRENAQRIKASKWLVDHAEITIEGQ